jgi:hypothetical protein
MKSIALHCTCGSSITLADAAESYINASGSPDKKGRRYLIEVRADEWQSRHQRCVDVKNQLLAKASERKPEPRRA